MISVAIFPYSLSLTYLRCEHDRLISVNLSERTSTHRKRNGKVRTLNLPDFCSVTPPPTTVSLQEGILAPRTTGRDQSAIVTLDLPPQRSLRNPKLPVPSVCFRGPYPRITGDSRR
jgi:hypothetical protein